MDPRPWNINLCFDAKRCSNCAARETADVGSKSAQRGRDPTLCKHLAVDRSADRLTVPYGTALSSPVLSPQNSEAIPLAATGL